MKKLIPIIFVTIVSGCTALKSPTELASEDTATLATAYNIARVDGIGREKLEAELRRRAAFTAEEWSLIQNSRVGLGMSEDAVLAAVGRPRSRGGHTSTELGTWSTWNYGHMSLTLKAGKVTAIDGAQL